MIESTLHLFWPGPIGPYQTDLDRLINRLELMDSPENCVEHTLQNFPNYPAKKEDELRFRAYLYVLRDLLRQGWQPHVRQGKLYLKPPAWTKKASDPDSIQQHKEAVRNSLDWERDRQFEQPSVRQFIQKMEQPRAFGNKQVSIRNLITDGQILAENLQPVVVLPESEQLEAIHKAVQPYLQLVERGNVVSLLISFCKISGVIFATPGARRTMQPLVGKCFISYAMPHNHSTQLSVLQR